MLYRVLVPAEPSNAIPRGAAVIEWCRAGRTAHGRVYADREQYGELCSQAIRQGLLVALPDSCTEVGFYDEVDGELRAHDRGLALLERWLGRPVSRGDLEAHETRSTRRAQARRLVLQGRFADAFKIDPRMGF